MTDASWVVSSLPWQGISSTISTLLGRLLSTLSWKTSPATLSPRGRRTHQYLPQGVLKVVRKLLSLSRRTCQYPDFASSKLKYLESASSGRMSSTVLLYHWFRFIAWLRSLGSRHSRKEQSGFLTGTMESIHSVCSLTSLMTPSCVNLSNSALVASGSPQHGVVGVERVYSLLLTGYDKVHLAKFLCLETQ